MTGFNGLKKFDLNFKCRLAGCDEAGRGPLAGPVVAAAVALKDGFYLKDIADSKKITQRKREKLYWEIIKNCEDYSFGVVFPLEINRINILQATIKAIETALANLKAPFDLCLVDGNMKFPSVKIKSIVKGDSLSFTIACASILAKVTRDEILKKYGGVTGFDFHKHKGYPTKHHKKEIYEKGITLFHRISYKPVHETVYLKIIKEVEETKKFTDVNIQNINLIKPYIARDKISFLRRIFKTLND